MGISTKEKVLLQKEIVKKGRGGTKEMKRGYFVHGYDDTWGIGVVAETAKEAKKLAFDSGEFIGDEWIDLRVRWEQDAKVDKLPIGIVRNLRIGLLCGLYCFIEGKCDRCEVETVLHAYAGHALCDECIEKEKEKDGKHGN